MYVQAFFGLAGGLNTDSYLIGALAHLVIIICRAMARLYAVFLVGPFAFGSSCFMSFGIPFLIALSIFTYRSIVISFSVFAVSAFVSSWGLSSDLVFVLGGVAGSWPQCPS